ncbi:MAG: SPFH domain-containing protein [Bacteroidales bacterium]|nr:SPFH domain-containing protein [Bacteroidales bacterium]
MAIIDVVKCEMNDSELCKKFHSEDLRLGSQLVVYPSQVAIFVKGGQIFDMFESGTHTLKTSNIPLLNKIINLPFGGNSPFQAEVWFLNLTAKLDVKWGTMTPIQLEDPKYEIIVPVRAYGQYGMKVTDPQHFLKTLIGNMTSFSSEKVNSYFKGKMLSLLNSTLAKKIANDKISILDINTHLVDTSEFCEVEMNKQFKKYGLQLLDFAIISINVPEDDPSIVKLKEAKDLAARLKITGRDVYQMERSFDVLETAAGNEGAGGQMIGMGAGIGAGIGLGSTMGNMTNQFMNTNPNTPPPLPQESTYFIYINGQQLSGQTMQNMVVYIQNGMMNGDTLVWQQGMPQWTKASQVPQLASLFNTQTPPPIPAM